MQEKIICFLKNLEIVILQVLVNDMSNTSIAEALYLSLSFHTHYTSIERAYASKNDFQYPVPSSL